MISTKKQIEKLNEKGQVLIIPAQFGRRATVIVFYKDTYHQHEMSHALVERLKKEKYLTPQIFYVPLQKEKEAMTT